MGKQTYQELTKVIIEDLKKLKEEGIEGLGEIDSDIYFFEKKKKNPERYERLNFDTNGHKPFSKDLSSILSDLRTCGVLITKYDIIQ